MTRSTLKGLLFIPAIFLAGCANDRYSATTGDPAQLRMTLDTCKHSVLTAYIHANPPGISGAGGAIGGAISGLVAASTRPAVPHISLSEINPRIERCMADAGYVGTSEN